MAKNEVQENTDNKDVENCNLQKEYDDLNDRYKRVFAEFENYKKRNQKEKDLLYTSITSDIAKQILPVLDNLENALKIETKDEEYKKGIELIYKQLQALLQSKGVQEIEAQDLKFDPELHEAVGTIEDETKQSQTIAQVYRKGYKIGDKIIRHSMVVVVK